MFHGISHRDGKRFPHSPRVSADTEAPSPLIISRTGAQVPDVFVPDANLVISSTVADLLKSIPNIRLMPVAFERIVDIPYSKGDFSFSWVDTYGDSDPQEYLETQPDVPDLHKTIGDYYELQLRDYKAFRLGYRDGEEIELMMGEPPWEDGMIEPTVLRMSKQLLMDYPIFKSRRVTVFSEFAFSIIRPHIDSDFYVVRRYEL